MDFFVGKEYLDEDSIERYENSEKIHILFFSGIDAIVIIILSMNLKSRSKKLIILKHKIIKIFIFDIIIRIINLRKYGKWIVYKEILTTVLEMSQFYLILSFLHEITYNIKTSKLTKSNDRIHRIKLCLLFLIISYSYEKINFPKKWDEYFYLPSYKMVILLESFIIVDVILVNYNYFFKLIWFVSTMIMNESSDSKENKENRVIRFINGSPFSCLFLFVLYYVLKIAFLFVTNPRLIVYSNIVLTVIKYTVEYFVFFTCDVIACVLNEIYTKKQKGKYQQFNTLFDEIEDLNTSKISQV